MIHTLTISVLELNRCAKRCSQVATSNSVISCLESTLINVKMDTVEFHASNLEVTVATRAQCQSSGVFSFLWEIKEITDLCAELPDMPLTIEFDDNETNPSIKINSLAGEFAYGTEKAEQFPKLPEVIDQAFALPNTVLQSLEKAIPFISDDTLRPALTGVYFDFKKDTDTSAQLFLVATDAHSLYKSEPYTIEGMTEINNLVVVPKRAITTLTSIGPKESINIAVSESHIMFSTSHTDIYARLIDARFPDYQAVIPTYSDFFVVEKREMQHATKLAGLTANKTTNQVVFKLEKNQCIVTSQDIDFNKAGKIPVPVKEQTCEDFTFALNGKIASRILNLIPEDITIHTDSQPNKAFLFTDGKCEDIFLMMPLMLSQ